MHDSRSDDADYALGGSSSERARAENQALLDELARKALVQRDTSRLYVRELGRGTCLPLTGCHCHATDMFEERILTAIERPAAILKRRLEQMGYDPADNVERLGTEEISFVLRFVFKSVGEKLQEVRSLKELLYVFFDLNEGT